MMADLIFASSSGFVEGLKQPGRNITGFATLEASLGGKWLELLSEIVPGLKRAAMMFNPDTAPASVYMPSFETAAGSLKVEAITAPVHDVHMLISIPPKYSVAEVIGYLKGKSSIWIAQNVERKLRNFLGHNSGRGATSFRPSGGMSAGSVSAGNVAGSVLMAWLPRA
jgi:hypothetical protein